VLPAALSFSIRESAFPHQFKKQKNKKKTKKKKKNFVSMDFNFTARVSEFVTSK